MRTRNEILDIADSEGLTIIETTSERSGYPCALQKAIVGFNTFKDAEEFADKYEMSLCTFTQKEGWNLWYRGNKPYEPLKITASDYGGDYNELTRESLEYFFEEHVSPILENCTSIQDVKDVIEMMEELKEELETADDNQLVITYRGEYYETIQKESMEWSHDGRTYIIGVI